MVLRPSGHALVARLPVPRSLPRQEAIPVALPLRGQGSKADRQGRVAAPRQRAHGEHGQQETATRSRRMGRDSPTPGGAGAGRSAGEGGRPAPESRFGRRSRKEGGCGGRRRRRRRRRRLRSRQT